MLTFCMVLLGFLSAIYFFLWYVVKRTVWCKSHTCLVGKTAIVTGANTGIGYETALDFAKRGARVILACRNEEKAETARLKIVKETGNENVVVKIVNFGSLQSVRNFAKDIIENEERLDILVNNAGMGGMGDKRTQDDFYVVMQVNYFSPFLLTNLLLDLLKKSGPSRIVNVSSILAKYSKFTIDDLNRFPGPYGIYNNSKLCNILFTMELAVRLKDTKVTAYALHPGAIKTEIFRRITGTHKKILDCLKYHFFQTSEEGAQTTIHVSTAQHIEMFNGRLFHKCEVIEMYRTAKVEGLAKKVWERSETLVGL